VFPDVQYPAPKRKYLLDHLPLQKKIMQRLLCTCSWLLIINLFAKAQTTALPSEKLDIRFHKNVELLGFLYFLGYEGEGIESETITIDGQEIPKKEWHAYGYSFYQKYQSFRASENLQRAGAVADHLWLDYLLNFLLQVADFPNATLHDGVQTASYLDFSKNKELDDARKKATIFLDALNALYQEVNFDQYLEEAQPYYDQALEEVRTHLPEQNFVGQLEQFFHQEFDRYTLIPSLTIPKGMGFGLRNKGQEVYNVFGAFGAQQLDSGSLKMGFNDSRRMRELSVHEFGHSFVNPVVAQVPIHFFETTETLFEPVQAKMYEQGYNTWKACMYEHFVRAVELILSEKYAPESDYQAMQKEYLEERQFIYIPQLRKVLEDYDEQGTTFTEAVREAMEALKKLATGKASSPENEACAVRWHTEDVTRFWKVYDQSASKFKGKIWQEQYIEAGSAGLQAFLKNRIENGRKLAKTLRKNKDYYEAIRTNSNKLEEYHAAVCTIYKNLEELYAPAVFPDIYFVIGRRNSGGTAFDGGLIIGLELFGQATADFQPDIPMQALDEIIAHELVHFQQNYATDYSLLAQCIREGSADFIGELLAGAHPNTETYAYGDSHEAALKQEFQQKMDGNNWQGWLYYQKDKSRPKDLGYWIGYKICEAYYKQVADKKQAIHDMLNIQDFKAFAKASGYFD